jgi:hypothetical protein
MGMNGTKRAKNSFCKAGALLTNGELKPKGEQEVKRAD